MRACLVYEIVDGKTQSLRQYFDMATFLQQLGLGASWPQPDVHASFY
jgi:limonene-1,2-epoxide hydrolase